MSDITNILPALPYFRAGCGASPEQIEQAERALNVTFADEYREYLAAFGAASAGGHELTGVGVSQRLDVVCVTEDERQLNKGVPSDLYVVEQANIDGIVFWQSRTGEIWQSSPWGGLERICGSLCEFLTENDETEE